MGCRVPKDRLSISVMTVDNSEMAFEAALWRSVGRTIGRAVPEKAATFVTRFTHYVEEVATDPNLRRAILRADGLRGSSRTQIEGETLASTSYRVDESPRYRELVEAMRAFLAARSPRRRRGPEAARIPFRGSASRYAELMESALEESIVSAEAFRSKDPELPLVYEATSFPETPPVLGGFTNGLIWIEAEPWVPNKIVFDLYRYLQHAIGQPARKVVQPKSLVLYLWVSRRRRETSETWRETMDAWNRTHEPQYGHESNFHKDFHRISHAIDNARGRFEQLRDEALRLELEAGLRS